MRDQNINPTKKPHQMGAVSYDFTINYFFSVDLCKTSSTIP